jgi:hypothetical protein
LSEHHSAIEADLAHYYGADLLDLYRGTLSVRKLFALVSGLPQGSALHRALRGDAADWDTNDYLLAAVVDYLAVANWLFIQANSKKGTKNPFPEPVKRPGAKSKDDEPKRFASAKEVSAFLARVTQRG